MMKMIQVCLTLEEEEAMRMSRATWMKAERWWNKGGANSCPVRKLGWWYETLVVVRTDLNSHSKAIKDYFLLGKGDFFQFGWLRKGEPHDCLVCSQYFVVSAT
ncbi:hypothetical protein E3N88_25635 [Mikania micrantha]|uniref:Uncharacterized protein n=1 Tax=Mikania micrantha TaxID=192012 RepID=A0A5N6N5P5_9ASTR|nr:hypothetical protein E3N88_25635 [Mikania micrantha]